MTPTIDILDFTDDRDYTPPPFCLRSYDLSDAFGIDWHGLRHNRMAEDRVKDHVWESDPALARRVEFDSEMGCFFAYAATAEDAIALRAAIYALLGVDAPPFFIET